MDPAIIGAIIAALLGGGLVQYLRAPSLNRADDAKAGLDEAQADVSKADAVDRWQHLYDGLQKRLEIAEGRVDDLVEEAAKLREAASNAEASAAEARLAAQKSRTEKAEAETRVAELEAELAREIATARQERHDLRNEFEKNLRDQDIARLREREVYESRIADLEEHVATLMAQAGQNDRRTGERRNEPQS